MPSLQTQLSLPRAPISDRHVREALDVVLNRFRWVTPTHYGSVGADERLDQGRDAMGTALELFRRGSVTLKGGTNSLYFAPDVAGAPAAVGVLSWFTPLGKADGARFRDEHRKQLVEVAKRLEAPVSWAGREDDHYRMLHRDVRVGNSIEVVLRLRSYEEGLLGLHWRNVYGPLFTDLFGREKLARLAPDVAQDCGDGYWFIEVCPGPRDFETEPARRRAAEVVDLLGPEHFYDFAGEQRPSAPPPTAKR
jgi:hypothetical protein